jgi:hypothetical protein
MPKVIACEADPLGPWRAQLVAAHESGHAVASVAAYGRSGKIILHADGASGDVIREPVITRREDDPEIPFLDLAVTLAGPVAEAAWWARKLAPPGKRHIPEALSLGSEDDYKLAVDLLDKLPGDPVKLLADAQASLEKWLLAPRRWRAVEALVARLLSRRPPVTLEGHEVAEIVREAAAP